MSRHLKQPNFLPKSLTIYIYFSSFSWKHNLLFNLGLTSKLLLKRFKQIFNLDRFLFSQYWNPVHDVIKREFWIQPVSPMFHSFHHQVQIAELFALPYKIGNAYFDHIYYIIYLFHQFLMFLPSIFKYLIFINNKSKTNEHLLTELKMAKCLSFSLSQLPIKLKLTNHKITMVYFLHTLI